MIHCDVALVGQLVAAQFPQWAKLPIKPVACDGWDNRTFRLGEEMTVRLPSAAAYAPQVAKEQRWLPRLGRSSPCRFLSRSRREPPPPAIPGIGRSTGGLKARSRLSSRSLTFPNLRLRWLNSFWPCSGSIPLVGHPLGSTTFFVAGR